MDLTAMAKEIEAVIEKHTGEKPGMAIAITLPPYFRDVHWITNVRREQGILLLRSTAQKMQAQTN